MISRRIPQTGTRLLLSRPPRQHDIWSVCCTTLFQFLLFLLQHCIGVTTRKVTVGTDYTTRTAKEKQKLANLFPTPFLLHFEDDRSHLDRGARAPRRESARKRGSNIIMMRSWNGRSGVCSWCLRASCVEGFGESVHQSSPIGIR